MKEVVEKLSGYLAERAGKHFYNAGDRLSAGQIGEEVEGDLEKGRKLLDLARGVQRFWKNLELDLKDLGESIPHLEDLFPSLRPAAPEPALEIPTSGAAGVIEEEPEIPQLEEITEAEKQRRDQLLRAINKHTDLTKAEKRSLEVGVNFSETNPASNRAWGRLYVDDPQKSDRQAADALSTTRGRALTKVLDDIELMDVKNEGRGSSYYLKYVGQPEVISRTVIIDGQSIEFPPRARESILATRTVANTSEEDQISYGDFVTQVYGQDTPDNRRKAQSMVYMANKRVLEKQGKEIVISGKGDARSVYLKRWIDLIRGVGDSSGNRGPASLTPRFTQAPNLEGLRDRYKYLPPEPLEDYSKLMVDPEIIRYINGVRSFTGELFREFLQNGESLTPIGNAIVKYRNLLPDCAVENLEVVLEQALLQAVGGRYIARNYKGNGMKLVTPTQVFLLYANANPQGAVIERENTFGLLPTMEGLPEDLPIPQGFLVSETADGVEIRRLLMFENFGEKIKYALIRKLASKYSPARVRTDLKLEDPLYIDRLTKLLHAVNPDIKKLLSVSSTLSVICGVLEKEESIFKMEGVEIEEVPVSITEIQGFGMALRKVLIPKGI